MGYPVEEAEEGKVAHRANPVLPSNGIGEWNKDSSALQSNGDWASPTRPEHATRHTGEHPPHTHTHTFQRHRRTQRRGRRQGDPSEARWGSRLLPVANERGSTSTAAPQPSSPHNRAAERTPRQTSAVARVWGDVNGRRASGVNTGTCNRDSSMPSVTSRYAYWISPNKGARVPGHSGRPCRTCRGGA